MEFPSNQSIKNFGITYSEMLKPGRNPVWFTSQGKKLAGNIFTPSNFDPKKNTLRL